MILLLRNPRQSAKIVLSIMAIAGIFLLVTFLRPLSETENQFLFGLSSRRLAIGVVFGLLVALNIGAVLWMSLKSSEWHLSIENKLIAWLTDHIALAIVSLYFVTLTTIIFLLAIIPPVFRPFLFLRPFREQIVGMFLWLFFASLFIILLFRLAYKEELRENTAVAVADRFLIAVILFLVTAFSYKHLLIWIGAANQSRYTYWNLLADSFLKGILYLENPSTTHDLTLYQGKWYVPMPPLPAILMMPLAYLDGGKNINTNDFSIIFSAINAALVFLILEQLVERKWIKLSRLGLILLVILFAFGTPHLWVGIRGGAWFVSQILTVTFLAMAIYATLKTWSPWVVGISLGAAILARPNGLMTWPFAFAIAVQILKEECGAVSWKQILNWSIKSILPMGLAVAGLLIYNYARFENFLDFGYSTLNGDAVIVANAQKYGLFSPHFIMFNIKVMLLYLPEIHPGSQWPILPSTTGTSIFLVTPPLIYLFHKYEHKWWILGAWASVFCNFILLVLYHNTGLHQFGYRYILDAMLPLTAMLAVALGRKIPWHFILLLLFSIAFNIYGANWFIDG